MANDVFMARLMPPVRIRVKHLPAARRVPARRDQGGQPCDNAATDQCKFSQKSFRCRFIGNGGRASHVSVQIRQHLRRPQAKTPATREEPTGDHEMKPTPMQAERDRATAGHLTQKFRAIGPAAILAALVCARRKSAQTQAEPAPEVRPVEAA